MGRLSVLCLFCLTFLGASGVRAEAATAPLAFAPAVTIRMGSDTLMTLDSNNPCASGPRNTYVYFRVTNTTGASLTNLSATITGFAGGITLSGGQVATQFLGTLAAGSTRTVYWYVQYPCAFDVVNTLTVSVGDGSSGTATGSGRVRTALMLSAGSGGNLISATVGSGAALGATITYDVTYGFGGVVAGDHYDMQPAGNSDFSAACFQLTGSLITSSEATAIPVGTMDTQHFVSTTAQSGASTFRVSIRYYFKYLCANVGSTARPYAYETSGQKLKYTGNYESFFPPLFVPAPSGSFTITKTVSSNLLAVGGTVTYTITITNTAASTAVVDSIYDKLPSGITYGSVTAASQVTGANSSSVPATGAGGTLIWRSLPLTTYAIPGGGSLKLVFTANVTSTPGDYTNNVEGFSGITSIGKASVMLTVGIRISVTPDGLTSAVLRLPGTKYSQAFTVTNGFSTGGTYDLLLTRRDTLAMSGLFLRIDSLTGPQITSSTLDSTRVSLAPNTSYQYTAWYTVPAGDTAVNVQYLLARLTTDAAIKDAGWAQVRRVFPSVSLTKKVTPNTNTSPGMDLLYSMEFGNAGEYAAQSVTVTDKVPVQVMFKLASTTGTLPAGITATPSYSLDGTAYDYVPVSTACGAPAGYDACVRYVKWILSGDLPAGSSSTAGILKFTARIR
ncbi:MAG TPA: hypothetical protein VM166_13115 [Gemmatimonadaceae bacterium]|nr:hypothetical protein [Gemmatimonadaceae bacterium]